MPRSYIRTKQKVASIEKERRIRQVMEWIMQDWRSQDIQAEASKIWGIEARMARHYIAIARKEWNKDEDEKIEQLRKMKINNLKALKNSLKPEFAGTPKGIRAILATEKMIIELEGLSRPIKVEHTGKNGATLFPGKSDDELLEMLEKAKGIVNDK